MTDEGGIGVVGVAGLGEMGRPMAERLSAGGFDVVGHDVRPAEDFGDFAPRVIADRAAFAARCRTVISVVRDAAQTEALCLSADGLYARGAGPRRLVICSTLSPRFVREFARRLPPGTAVVDAPVSGAPFSAAAGTLTFMVGGGDADIAALMPLFKTMGRKVHHLGALSNGMATKVVNNFIAASSFVSLRHARRARNTS